MDPKFALLVQQQSETGKQIVNLIKNFKKDSLPRKTRDYLQKRIRELSELWQQFEGRDKELAEFGESQADHEYFHNRYFVQVQLEYSKTIDTMQQLLAKSIDTTSGASGAGRNYGENVNSLLHQQQFKMQAITRLMDAIDASGDGQPRSFYELKLSTLNQYWSEIRQHQEMMVAATGDAEFNLDTFMQAEERVQNTLLFLQTALQSCSTSVEGIRSTRLKLPQVTVPIFDGDYLKWPQFQDLFLQIIHTQSLSNVEKMWFLKANLQGEAERLIRHLPVTTENYDSAWTTLTERYNNTRLTVARILDKLITQPCITCDSAAEIKHLHDTTKECCMGLINLQIDTSTWDPIILHIVQKKLSKETRSLYEQSLKSPRTLQLLSEFLEFLERRFQSLEAVGSGRFSKRTTTVASATSESSPNKTCISCNLNHPLFVCPAFLKLAPRERLSLVRKHGSCTNCLKSGHLAKNCLSRTCIKCNGRHNTLLHLDSTKGNISTPIKVDARAQTTGKTSKEIEQNNSAVTLTASKNSEHRNYILLGTAMINLVTNDGKTLECRALLDSGSQVNLMTERIAKKLNISRKPDKMIILGVGDGKRESAQRVNAEMRSRTSDFTTRVEAFVLPNIITRQPTQYLDRTGWPIPENISLADPRFNTPARIDILLGAEFYHQLIVAGQIKLGDGLPVLQNTTLGWIITGKIDNASSIAATCGIYGEDEDATSQLIEKFWKLEDLHTSASTLTHAERRCEAQFAQTVERDQSNRFIVALPISENPEVLGESKQIALNRFYAIERKLEKNPDLKLQYTKFMEEYSELGHMEEISLSEVSSPSYFLPHHYVLKPESSTTKLRVVFDASCKTSTGYSLNDILHNGPTLQSDLFSILLRFRLPRYVFTSDIEKMYRQILMRNKDRNFQLIFWRSSPKDKLKVYQLCTATYGTRSAPYLATKCLQILAQENRARNPRGARALRDDFYMDDVMTGADSLYDAKETQRELINILKNSGFKLRKWGSNHPQLLEGIPAIDQEVELDLDHDTSAKINTLGLTWLPNNDQFRIKTRCRSNDKVTKRVVSSDMARLFDPLGVMAPVVVSAKIFLQQLWQQKLDWDEELPAELRDNWLRFRDHLKAIDNLQFPRHVYSGSKPTMIQIHAFSDASEKAYGAAVYLRAFTEDKRLLVHLLCAKSRVAPLQRQTLPHLELCAAVLASQLVTRVKGDLGYEDAKTFYWTDSEIVLAWINSEPSTFQVFVGNRVAKIQELTRTTEWRHVSTTLNPADIVSRGLSPERLAACSLRFYGPLFLHGNESLWPPMYTKSKHLDSNAERKKSCKQQTMVMAATEVDDIIYKINHRGSFRKLQRIVVYMRRLIIRDKNRPPGTFTITPLELEGALNMIIRQIQKLDFQEEFKQLKKFGEVNKNSPISSLTPFLDANKIIRVGGRLEASNLSYNAKHPMLIPYSDPITKLLMECLHRENAHCGPQTLLSITRQQFWPLKGKSLARSIVQHCIICTRAKPKLITQMMGNLPRTRTQAARPFLNAGVDFCGPIWVHYQIRGKRPHKAYIAVFCCFTTKAVHLEVVSNLSTEAFIGALNRFVGRRGHCTHLYCDNATNFVGARNQLAELKDTIYSTHSQEKIISVCNKKHINFHFIPPRAPHFGGLWEAAVKSAKHLLLRSIGTASLTYEELETTVIGIEAILNSRPITPMSADPNDLSALTPGHFLIGEPLTTLADPQAKSSSTGLLTRWNLVNQLKNEFWKRWSAEYLNELQYRHKWKEQNRDIKPGMLVIIKEDNLPVMQWPLGRIVQIYKGDDGLVRVVDIKTAKGTFKRAINRLSPLPIEEPDTEKPTEHEQQSSSATAIAHMEKEADAARPKKRIKLLSANVLTTLLTVLLILPTIITSPVTVQKFKPVPGIYFGHIGNMELISTQWQLLVYFDLHPFKSEMSALKNGTAALEHLCRPLGREDTCDHLVAIFQHVYSEIELGNAIFTSNRVKRGAANIVGNIANSLFGILDSSYADQMSEIISSVKRDEDYLLRLLRNQTSIIDSTINIMKRDQQAAEGKFKVLENQIAIIMNAIQEPNVEQIKLRTYKNIFSITTQLTLIAGNLYRIQSAILDILTSTHHGQLSPILLSPEQLKTELISIRAHLPKSVHLPVQQNDLTQLYKLMSVHGGVTASNIIFKIAIPLASENQFNLFKVIPIPMGINGKLTVLIQCSTHLAINLHRDEYIPLGTLEVRDCLVTNHTKYFCKPTRPIYRKGADVCACEIQMFNNLTDKHCTLKEISPDHGWISLSYRNQWIYGVTSPTRLGAVCGDEILQSAVEGSGLLTLAPNCVVKFNSTRIQGHQIFSSNQSSSYSSLGVVQPPIDEQKLKSIAPLDFRAYRAQLQQLTEIQDSLKHQGILDFPDKYMHESIHHFSISYTALSMAIVIIAYLLLPKSMCKCKRKPIPAPRQHQSSDFSVNV